MAMPPRRDILRALFRAPAGGVPPGTMWLRRSGHCRCTRLPTVVCARSRCSGCWRTGSGTHRRRDPVGDGRLHDAGRDDGATMQPLPADTRT